RKDGRRRAPDVSRSATRLTHPATREHPPQSYPRTSAGSMHGKEPKAARVPCAPAGASICAAAFRARERKFRFRRPDEIIVIAGARDRPHRGGIELAVADEAVVDIDRDHLTEHDVALSDAALDVVQAHRLQPLAFERAGRIFYARRLHKA